MTKPTPINKEKLITTEDVLMIKADRTGVIEYVNYEFAEISEYEIDELIGKEIDFLNHPGTPTLVYDHIWEALFNKKQARAILKNITKFGMYYWLQVNFDFKVNEETREIEYIYGYFSKVSDIAKKELDVFYTRVSNIEKHAGPDVAEHYIEGFMDEKKTDFQTFIEKHMI